MTLLVISVSYFALPFEPERNSFFSFVQALARQFAALSIPAPKDDRREYSGLSLFPSLLNK